jgi:Kef-type K+ transport system membrane component KefB
MSTLALFTRQSLLVAYIILGVLLGPSGFKLVSNSGLLKPIGDVGIIFLLFLLGLNLHPQSLLRTLRKTVVVTVVSSLLFAGVGFLVAYIFRYSYMECLIVGMAMMFSSTIIGLKLLPTTVLHHRHAGQIMISVLLLQDLVAIVTLLFVHVIGSGDFVWSSFSLTLVALPVMFLIAYLVERFVLVVLITKFAQIREYIFLVSIAWCLSMAQLAGWIGLSTGIGAFIAGITIATNPISEYIAESLKPLRDFFLIIFFFYIGAELDLGYLKAVIIPAIILAILMLLLKPIVFRYLLRRVSETKELAWEIGMRLGQGSEFSLMIAYLALGIKFIDASASYLMQLTTILTFIVSTYIVILKYPTPMALSDELRRD